ncbi:hypothetical protein BJV82DRAFT_596922 [Fennellomyces sp. T-0311]|nr:hypothetical protein BJV82DRAFT_596922 [Fennellomyces sp. T-0311]
MNKRQLSAPDSTKHPNKRMNVDNGNISAIRNIIYRLSTDSVPDKAIRDSTLILDDLNETRYIALTVRSEAFRKQGKLCNAIDDTSEMIRIKPKSVQGYLLAGDLYVMQGRQLAAVRVLDDGLAAVPSSSHHLLRERRELARQSLEIKKDFITMIPCEIVTKIFIFLSYTHDDALFRSTLISKQWRTTLLSMPDLWTDASNSDSPNATFRLLPSISKYIKTFDIGSYTKEFSDKLIELTTASMFPSLRALIIEYDRDNNKNTCYRTLVTLLGKQLEDLTLDGQKADPSQAPVLMDLILSHCVNLKRLVLLAPGAHAVYDPSKSSHPNPLQLEMLFLQAENENAVLEKLLPQCPRLRVLNMMPDRPKLIQILNQHCAYLQELNLNDGRNSFATAFPALNKYEYGEQPVGLKRLVYHTENESCPDLHDLVPLLAKSKDTLEHLVLLLASNDDKSMEQTHWDSLATGSYAKLKFADITWRDEKEGRIGVGVSRMLRGSSSLESVRIGVDHNVRVPDDFFISLTASSQLSSLTAYLLTESLGGLIQLFNHHLNIPSTLESIILFQCPAMTDDSLYALACLPALAKLTIIGPLPLVSHQGVVRFLKKLGCSQSLLFLTLIEMNYLEDSSVAELEDATGLKRSKFVSRLEVTRSGEKYLCSTARLRAPIANFE